MLDPEIFKQFIVHFDRLCFWNGLSGMPQHGIDRSKNILFSPRNRFLRPASDLLIAAQPGQQTFFLHVVFEVQREDSSLHRYKEQKFARFSAVVGSYIYVLFNWFPVALLAEPEV